MPHLNVHADARLPIPELELEDRAVPGVYRIWVDPRVPREHLESAALDVFHSHVAVGVLDHFDFSVTDDDGRPLPDQSDAERYQYQDAGRLD